MFFIASTQASGPSSNRLINYQLRLSDPSGIPVADGTKNIKISFYAASTGGTPVATDCGTTGTPVGRKVVFTNGVGSVLIGDTTADGSHNCTNSSAPNAISATLFDNTSLFIGITVEADAEMTPRKRIVATGYSLNADKLDDMETSAIGGSNAFVPVTDSSGNFTLTKNVGFGVAADPDHRLISRSVGDGVVKRGVTGDLVSSLNLFDMAGVSGNIRLSGTNTVSGTGIAAGVRGHFESSAAGAAITHGASLSATMNLQHASTFTNIYGLYVADVVNASGGTLTNTYGIFIADQTDGTQTNAPYGVFQSDAGSRNFFAGNVGVGDSDPANFKLEVAGHVGPGADDTHDLGSNLLRWRDLYTGPGTIHIGTSTTDEGTISYNTTTNALQFDSTGTVDIAGGSGSTGCSVDASGNLSCSGTVSGGGGGASFVNGGNTFGAAAILGTNDTNSLSFETNNVAYLTIANGGGFALPVDTDWTLTGGVNGLSFDGATFSVDAANNRVGIGTASPSVPLEIRSSTVGILVDNNADGFSSIDIDSGLSAADFSVLRLLDRGSNKWELRKNSANHFDIRDSATPSAPFTIETGAPTNSIYTRTSTGNVGIGTSTASERLQVAGNGRFGNITVGDTAANFVNLDTQIDGNVLLSSNLSVNDSNQLVISNSHSAMSGAGIHIPGNGRPRQGTIEFWTTPTGAVTAGNNFAQSSPRVVIDNNGNLGIGDTDPANFKLEVAGHVGPGTHDTFDLGSDTLRWRDLYLGPASIHLGTSGDEARITYNTATDEIEFDADGDGTPDATIDDSGNISADGTVTGGGGSGGFADGGNSFGAAATLGTNDNFSLALETNNSTRMTIDAAGKVGLGTTGSSYMLDVMAPALAGQELLTRWRTSDDANGFLDIMNGTGSDTLFAPQIRGRAPSDASRPGLIVQSQILTANDSGTMPIMLFDSGRTTGATVTRPAYRFDSFGVSYMTIAAGGNVGVGTTSPSTRLQLNNKIVDDNGFAYDTDSAYMVHQTPTSTTVLNDPKTVLMLGRQGTGGQSYGAAAAFNLSRYENVSTNSRTRLDISLANGSFDPTSNTVMTLLSSGRVGIGTTTPGDKLDVNGGATIRGNIIQTSDSPVLFASQPTTANDVGRQMYMDTGSAIASSHRLTMGLQTASGQISNGFTTGAVIWSGTQNASSTAYDLYLGAHTHDGFTGADPAKLMVFKASNFRVGIHTASPASTFDVAGSVSLGAYAGVNAAPTNGMIVSGNVGIGTNNPLHKLHVVGQGVRVEVGGGDFPRYSLNKSDAGSDQKKWQNYATATGLNFSALNDAESAENFWMQVARGTGTAITNVSFPNGNVGIGTASPGARLDLAGNLRTTGKANGLITGSINPTASTAVVGVGTLFTTELVVGDQIAVNGEGRTVVAITDNTNLTVDTAFTDTPNDTSIDVSYAMAAFRDSGGATRAVMSVTGAVGIGTAAPTAGSLTVGDANRFVIFTSSGTAQTAGDIAINGGDLTTSATTFNLLNTTATTVNFAGAATTLNLGPSGAGAASVNLAGGSGDTGCTVANASGNLTCTGSITGAATGTIGYWTRTGTTLNPATGGDNIATGGTGAITSAGLLTASNGFTLSSGALNLTAGAVNLTGTSGSIALTGFGTTSITSTTATGNIFALSNAALTGGTLHNISSTSNAFSSGVLLGVHKSSTTGSTAFTGGIQAINYTQTFTGGVGLNSTGKVLQATRFITLDNVGQTHTVSGALASFSDNGGEVAGQLDSTADVVQIGQNYLENTGAALNVTTATSFAGLAMRVNDDGTFTDSSSFAIDNTGEVGIGTTIPTAKLSIVATGNELGGTAKSATLMTTSGTLGTTAGNELALASFGFASGNSTHLGVRAYRATSGSDWTTTAIGLGVDVDDTVRAGFGLFLHSNDNIGIGTPTPNEQLEITGNLRLPATTATTGIIKSGTNPFIHSFGTDNFFAGVTAGNLTMTGSSNVGVGLLALNGVTSGINNTALGRDALRVSSSGNYQTAVGSQALENSNAGNGNTAVGFNALFTVTTSAFNSALGAEALYLTTGSGNTAMGHQAGNTITTGTDNTFIGLSADAGSAALTNATAIGANALVTTSNSLVLGSGVNVGIGTTGPTAKLHIEGTSPEVLLNGTTSNMIRWGTAGVAAPTITTARSVGTKLVLWPNFNSGVTSDYAIGVSSGALWFSTDGDSFNVGHQFYAGATLNSQMNFTGEFGTRTLGGSTSNSLCYNTSTIAGLNTLSTCTSSIRYKEDVKNLIVDTDKVLALRGVDFKWKDRDERSVGFIAEEVAQLIPEIITYKDGLIDGVEYKLLTPYIIDILKQHHADLAKTPKMGEEGNLALKGNLSQYFASDESLEPGEIVMIDASTGKMKRAADTDALLLAGVVAAGSADGHEEGSYPIALQGKVLTRVVGKVSIGDPITMSLTPGVGVVAEDPTYVVGIALDAHEDLGPGMVHIFLKSSWYNGSSSPNDISGVSPTVIAGTLTADLDLAGYAIHQVGRIGGINDIWSIDGEGNFNTRGLMSSETPTDTGPVKAYAPQSLDPEIVLSGSANLESGQAVIEFDQDARNIISGGTPLRVTVSLTSSEPIGIYVAEKGVQGFKVMQSGGGTSNASFDWIVVARRRGFDDPVPDTQGTDIEDSGEQTVDNPVDEESPGAPEEPAEAPVEELSPNTTTENP